MINNVRLELTSNWYGSDGGCIERDESQFDQPADVLALCGAAVLLGPSYLDDAGLFDERIFLYDEDLELLWRGRERGWRYRYAPEGVVRHVHSATSVEGSTLSHHYNERNRSLGLARRAPLRVGRTILRYILITVSLVAAM
jgi:GT2 family glycosyltransferase